MYFSVPLDEKVPEGAEPRFWEEEGFYVGKPPQVSPANLNIMENRIKDGNQVFIMTRYMLWPNLKVPITPKYFFRLNKSLHLFETNCTFLN